MKGAGKCRKVLFESSGSVTDLDLGDARMHVHA